MDCAKVHSALDNLVSHRVDSSAEHWTEEVDNVVNNVAQVINEQEKLRMETRSTLNKYISEELVKDIPTGLYNYEIIMPPVW